MADTAKKEKDEDFDIDAWVRALDSGRDVGKIVISTGKEVGVKKATATELFLIIDILKSIAIHLNIKNFDNLGTALNNINDPVSFLGMIGGSLDRAIDLIAALCDLGKETVHKGLDLDDLLLIAWAEWKVNEHFFTTRLLPLVRRLGIEEQSPEQED